ncbi:hypothetical protein BJV77DRAFT_962536 [Russula vinacea]|nr:hypothetical protein BJV77DRAFT_962536 [Russula vinacea]
MCLQRRPMPGEVATWWGRQAAPASVAASGEGMSPQPANNSYVGHRAATANGVHPGTQAGGESAQPRKRHIGRHPQPITEPRQASAAHLDTRQAFTAYKGTQAGICGTPGQPNVGMSAQPPNSGNVNQRKGATTTA